MSLEDPSIIIDLRINNGFQGSNSIYFGMNLMNILMRTTLPDDDAVPSEGWIRLNFAPSNAHATKAMHYTGCFNVKYKVQSRLLRKSTDHDKHKVPIGEGVHVSAGVHNKKTLPPAEGKITAADHDFTKKVYVCYKDTVFQPSSALRHSTEFFNLKADELEDEFETLKTLEDIREKSKDNPNLKAELQNASQQ
ncbi:hypothetical protein RhiirA5_418084 [Rhizophagus irregularis]|uniref:Uncharacterized protein n=1 Tax=Rhizophagus irregularis TaxID=588596 RepID=A0A2N0PL18_9GLOM|nr:hypothetical protein RhiirA5_418084 [Rhizophagus irregularis]